MSTDIKSVPITMTVSEVCKLFLKEEVKHIPVLTESGEVVGMFSMTDAMKMFHEKIYNNPMISREDLKEMKLREFITSDKLHSINENESLKKAAKKMNKAGINSLLVYNNQKELAGIITTTDLPA